MIWHFHPDNFDSLFFKTFDISDYVGFVYVIRRKADGKSYIGQKTFFSAVKKAPLKGKVRVRRSKKESDWKTYWGSNDELKADVALLGTGAFERSIIRVCKSKAEMNYYELKEQMAHDALLRDDYYNGYVGGRITRSMVRSFHK